MHARRASPCGWPRASPPRSSCGFCPASARLTRGASSTCSRWRRRRAIAAAAVAGIGAGRAVVIGAAAAAADDEGEGGGDLSIDEAVDLARRDLDALIASMPREEAALFEPVRPALEELAERVRARTAKGDASPWAILEEHAHGRFDVLEDARARLLDALNGGDDARAVARALVAVPAVEPVVAVFARPLTPTLVARLPANVVALVAGDEAAGGTSHAAILARGRDLPLARVPDHVLDGIPEGEVVLVDTTEEPARIWVAPSCDLVAEAEARRAARARARDEGARASVAHLGVALRVNIGSARDDVPAGAEGVGLLRTEIAFAGRSEPPSEHEQAGLLDAVAKKAGGHAVVMRLFDAGGDKPVPWLPPPADVPDARGIQLLRFHPDILGAQLRALRWARGDFRLLVPLARTADDVDLVRARAGMPVPVGAMIETADAVDTVDSIAATADFLCIGTNDLAASLLGVPRAAASRAVDPRLFAAVLRIVEAARAAGRGLTVTVCGEIAADPAHAKVLIGLGVDALSVAPAALGPLKAALARATLDECRALAERATLGAP
jgi:phosphoenolpyruvate-protein kinase (PTS system EI component)